MNATGTTSSTSGSVASNDSPDVTTHITEWRLAPAEIQTDLTNGTTIVRTKDNVVGAPTGHTDDSLLVTMVKGKLQADSQLSSAAAKIDVEAHNGEVTLKGTAASADQVGRAIALALNTEGVTKVSSQLKLEAKASTATSSSSSTTP
ncbi:MAG TPA: BON domain-containing protein [Opitutaceae bacterium]|nr:BON domain-containing protein [Opitutaceae bacterium]